MTAPSSTTFSYRVRYGANVIVLTVGVALLAAIGLWGARTASAENAHVIPAPAVDEPASQAPIEVAVFAGGCFWGVQGVFQHVSGVTKAVSGYTGGDGNTAHYEEVGSGDTGHAESVQVTYDPRKITYGQLLQVFFSVAHDPTELDHQGPDFGTQYRSAIFPTDSEQAKVAKAYIDQLGQAKAFPAAIVTRIEPGKTFYPAETYHQNYLTLHPDSPYIAINDLPKLDALRRLFPSLYRADPTLVVTASVTN